MADKKFRSPNDSYTHYDNGCLTNLLILTTVSLGLATIHSSRKTTIPSPKKVQSGYANPSQLEIKLRDLDDNGEQEVIMTYEGQPYLFKLNEHNQPSIQPYNIVIQER